MQQSGTPNLKDITEKSQLSRYVTYIYSFQNLLFTLAGPQVTENITRTVTIEPKHNQYDPAPQLGTSYTVLFWYSPEADNIDNYQVAVTIEDTATTYEIQKDPSVKWVKVVINETPGASAKVTIVVTA